MANEIGLVGLGEVPEIDGAALDEFEPSCFQFIVDRETVGVKSFADLIEEIFLELL